MPTKTSKPEPRYKWSHPRAWFDHFIEGDQDREQLANIARQLADLCDGDQLQDLFQSEMDDDGYFQDLNAIEEEEDDDDA